MIVTNGGHWRQSTEGRNFRDSRVPSRHSVSAAAPWVEVELDLPRGVHCRRLRRFREGLPGRPSSISAWGGSGSSASRGGTRPSPGACIVGSYGVSGRGSGTAEFHLGLGCQRLPAGRGGTRPSPGACIVGGYGVSQGVAGTAEFHLGIGCQRPLRWSRWNSTLPRGVLCRRLRRFREGLPGRPSSISAWGVSCCSVGRGGTRPSQGRALSEATAFQGGVAGTAEFHLGLGW